ncbi:hypothetical protein, partial [Streptomyces sp. URMC 123]|uniref:hypothetical protein n=1 Tax=Streptomyces sp. URMC 123 TaxID=3423403 RepID=UPI003F19C10B
RRGVADHRRVQRRGVLHGPTSGSAPAPARAGHDHVTRRELEELARRVQQLSQLQVQLMSQVAQLLDRQLPAPAAAAPDGKASS